MPSRRLCCAASLRAADDRFDESEESDGGRNSHLRFRLEGAVLHPSGHRRQDLQPRGVARAERHAGDVHLQSLSLRQGGDRPHRARCNELRGLGIGAVAISSNDAVHYPEDSFANMRRFAEAHRFSFPYLYDESQDVARAYDAVCTPDFFGFNADLELQYRGRLDASRKEAAPADCPPRPVRGDEANRRDRPRPARADPVDRLLDQMESRLARPPLTSA